MPTLSVVVITLNEARNLAACLESIPWADEFVIVDSGSVDGTVALAGQMHARVVTRPFTDFADQKNFALDQASCDWVLSLDADERLTPELAEEIKQAIASPENTIGFALPRHEYLWGSWIRHGLWRQTHMVRLIRHGKGQWRGNVHERLIAFGPVRRLASPFLHCVSDTISDTLLKTNKYTSMEAEAWYNQGVQHRLWKLVLYPPALFLYSYVFRLGLFDGGHGFVHTAYMAYYTFLKRAKLWELSRTRRPR